MEWVRAFLAITLGVIALQPARAAVGIARDMHTTRWPESLTRWALVNRLYLVAFDVVTIYVYAVLGVNSIATITLLMFTCGTLVVAFLQRTGTLARLSPRTRRIVGWFSARNGLHLSSSSFLRNPDGRWSCTSSSECPERSPYLFSGAERSRTRISPDS